MDALELVRSHALVLPLLAKFTVALAHVRFETIHPFLDGNGRVGRLLITLLLCADGTLRQPLLYLSLFFKLHRSLYYDLLNQIREEGDWGAWLAFFLEGVAVTGNQAFQTATKLLEIFKEDRDRNQRCRSRGSVGARIASLFPGSSGQHRSRGAQEPADFDSH
ncbi:MAG: Fic family protein, partial [Terrimicrobiaceae bacterium]